MHIRNTYVYIRVLYLKIIAKESESVCTVFPINVDETSYDGQDGQKDVR
jgi:hypothetical protein